MLPTGGPRPRPLAPIVLLLLLLGAARRGVDSSAGDTEPQFARCAADCAADCPPHPDQLSDDDGRRTLRALWPLLREGLEWSCAEECAYSCMHRRTAERVAAGEPVLQYHGK